MTDDDIDNTLNAVRRVSVSWTPARRQRSIWAVMARIERRRRRQSPLLFAPVGAAAIAVGVYIWCRPRPVLPVSVATSVIRSAVPDACCALTWTLGDGSRIVLDDAATVLRKKVEYDNEVLFDLETGGAHFEVARRPSRVFRVHAGPVTIEVIGTGFRVQRSGTQSFVAVDHGRVLVSWWGGSRELGPTDEGTFPPASTATLPADSTTLPPARRPTARAARFRVLAAPELLFQRADRARRDGDNEAAIASLRALLDAYPHDANAPAAAFTVGHLLLETSRRPREAALAFEQARKLAAGKSALAEDALAREVEALDAAGDVPAARARAELYLSLFPTGLRKDQVTTWGGLTPGAQTPGGLRDTR